MIKRLKPEQTGRVMELWLNGNKTAHSFLPVTYWESHYQEVEKEYLPNSETFVMERNAQVCGFVSVVNGEFIGALFVAQEVQSQGIGAALLDFCKQKYSRLSLTAYVENIRAVSFYQRHGFQIQSCSTAADGVQKEYTMLWKKK